MALRWECVEYYALKLLPSTQITRLYVQHSHENKLSCAHTHAWKQTHMHTCMHARAHTRTYATKRVLAVTEYERGLILFLSFFLLFNVSYWSFNMSDSDVTSQTASFDQLFYNTAKLPFKCPSFSLSIFTLFFCTVRLTAQRGQKMKWKHHLNMTKYLFP